MSGFFEELKRRKVYRVAIAYIVAAWALAQGLTYSIIYSPCQAASPFHRSNSIQFGIRCAMIRAFKP